MPTITEVREAFKAIIVAAVPELVGYDTTPDVVQIPCVVAQPATVDYIVAGGTCQDWDYRLFVLVSRTESNFNQKQLDAYLSTTGPKSIVAAIRANPSLGISGIDAVVVKMSMYGGSWEVGNVKHVGAQLHVRVLVTE